MVTSVEKRELLKQGWSREEIEQLEIQQDPVLWAENFLRNPNNPLQPLKLRSYQKEILRCRAKKRVLRIGRRSGKSICLCVDMLWKAFTSSDRKILVCTPYKKQTIELWKNGLMKLIKDNPFIEQSVSRIGQNPHTVEFKNGSVISGMTAGSSTGNKGTSIRGSDAQDLYMDETDYMGQEAIMSIIAIVASRNDTTLTISSTPTGKREFFWKACHDKKLGYEEFHYASTASPEWISIEEAKKRGMPIHESQEYFFRNTYSEYEYRHEILADFGEEAQGVFKHRFIDTCMKSYVGEEMDPKGTYWFCGSNQVPGNIYSMGVDWNGEKVGTQIVIMEYCKEPTEISYEEYEDADQIMAKQVRAEIQGKFRVFYRESVSIENMTQLESIKRIIQLNTRFRVDHLYVDFGYGHTNLEELKLHAIRNHDKGFLEKLKPIDFHGKLVIWDPYSKAQVEKSAKQFMVNNAVTCLERGELVLPESEDEKIKLVGQMREYTIERISPQGTPSYSKGNDHILDAFMLSLLAYQMEYSELVQVKFSDTVGIVEKPRMFLGQAAEVPSRWADNKKDALAKYNVPQRSEALGTGKYTADSRASYMDYDELVKETKKPLTPFGKVGKTSWSRHGAPTRSMF